MRYDVYNRIHNDINLKNFLRENSIWYKRLNRNPDSFSYFVRDMKIAYHLTVQDRINKTIDNISMLESFLDVLKN